jgi:hypothetical protein
VGHASAAERGRNAGVLRHRQAKETKCGEKSVSGNETGTHLGNETGRVDLGGHPPRSPTDPDVRVKRIRLFIL